MDAIGFDLEQQIHSFVNVADRRSALRIQHVRLLSGGYSGAVVSLAWVETMPPIVVKFAPIDAIKLELEGRQNNYARNAELAKLGINECGPEFTVRRDGQKQIWASMAYLHVGGLEYSQIKHYVDFEEYAQAYVSGSAISESVEECLRQLLRFLRSSDTPARSQPPASLPVSYYVQSPSWDAGLANILGVVECLLPSLSGIENIREWFETNVKKVHVAPFQDERDLHGDPRFANVLVDRVHSIVNLIDYGNPRRGHIFHDLVRFEVDIWFRVHGAPELVTGSKSAIADLSAIRACLKSAVPSEEESNQNKLLHLWRKVLAVEVPELNAPGSLDMYCWFLLTELLRRLRWVRPGAANDPDTDALAILACIQLVRNRLNQDDPGEPDAQLSLLRTVSLDMGLQRVYLPTVGHERTVNALRNRKKRAALIRSRQEPEPIRLVAETGNSYLHTRGAFFEFVSEALRAGQTLTAVIRAATPDRATAPGDRRRKYEETIDGATYLNEQWPGKVAIRVIDSPLAATLLLTQSALFYEPYLPSYKSRRQHVLFDTFEFEFSGGHSAHVRHMLVSHFEYLFDIAEPIDIGGSHSR